MPGDKFHSCDRRVTVAIALIALFCPGYRALTQPEQTFVSSSRTFSPACFGVKALS